MQAIEQEVLYKYKVQKSQNNRNAQNISKQQQMLYLQDDEAYEQMMEDYDDKVWNDQFLNQSNNVASPHTLLNPSYYEDQMKEPRRVRTPIGPVEELKTDQRLRTSGSYSIESFRKNKNGPLMFSKIDSADRIAQNTNHLKIKGGRYGQKVVKATNSILTMEVTGVKSGMGTIDQTKTMGSNPNANTKNLFESKNVSCLSSPYLNKPNVSHKNIHYNYEVKATKMMNKTETAGFKKQGPETTKVQLRNQMMDLELLKLPSIGNEDGTISQNEKALAYIGN